MPVARKGGKKGKPPDKRPCHARYNAQRRDIVNKRRRVEKSSHGAWTYEQQVTHQKGDHLNCPKVCKFKFSVADA